MSEKYIKQTKKGKGRTKKTRVKEIKELYYRIKPELHIMLGLMVIKSLKDKENKKNEK